jgi:hypothetical protein
MYIQFIFTRRVRVNPFKLLPSELIELIFSHLDILDLINIRLVCKASALIAKSLLEAIPVATMLIVTSDKDVDGFILFGKVDGDFIFQDAITHADIIHINRLQITFDRSRKGLPIGVLRHGLNPKHGFVIDYNSKREPIILRDDGSKWKMILKDDKVKDHDFL